MECFTPPVIGSVLDTKWKGPTAFSVSSERQSGEKRNCPHFKTTSARAVAVPGQTFRTLLRFPPSSIDSPTFNFCRRVIITLEFHMLDVLSRIQQPASSYIPHEHMSIVESVFK